MKIEKETWAEITLKRLGLGKQKARQPAKWGIRKGVWGRKEGSFTKDKLCVGDDQVVDTQSKGPRLIVGAEGKKSNSKRKMGRVKAQRGKVKKGKRK
jgi:hypothetical protein